MTLKQAGEIDIEKKEPSEPEENSIKTLRSFFTKKIETRSIVHRDRIAKRYHSLIKNAVQTIVNKETKAIKAQITKRNKRADNQSFTDWIDSFYDDFDSYIKRQAGPVLRSYMESIRDASITEIGTDIDSSEINDFINKYIDTYAQRYILSSKGQLNALYRDETEDEINQRADEWHEKRAGKDASNETTRSSNAVYQAVAFAAGMSTVWRIRGAKTCLYCKSLDGKRVARGQSYVKDGQNLNPDGVEAPMKIRGMKAHPPLHKGCDCYLAIK